MELEVNYFTTLQNSAAVIPRYLMSSAGILITNTGRWGEPKRGWVGKRPLGG
jgi:hypothetical protein